MPTDVTASAGDSVPPTASTHSYVMPPPTGAWAAGATQIRHRQRPSASFGGIRRSGLFTRIVCGDVAGVERIVAVRRVAAIEPGRLKNWPPLLYLCAGRLTTPAFCDNAVAIARAPLDRGADPDVYGGCRASTRQPSGCGRKSRSCGSCRTTFGPPPSHTRNRCGTR
jgi:hypothetical protein